YGQELTLSGGVPVPEADLIRTPDQRVRVFVSSTLRELAAERQAVREAVTRLRLVPVMFELGARPHPPGQLYRAYLAQRQVFVGVYWDPGSTEEISNGYTANRWLSGAAVYAALPPGGRLEADPGLPPWRPAGVSSRPQRPAEPPPCYRHDYLVMDRRSTATLIVM